MSAETFFETARELEAGGTSFVTVTLISGRGYVPQEVGAKAIITAEGLHWGTVGGGKVEARTIREAQEWIASEVGSDPRLVTWNLQKDIGMTCGGEVTYLFERHSASRWRIVIFGAGHVAQALVRALEPIDCQIICVDSRMEWVERLPRSRKIQALCISEPASLVPSLDPNSFFVVMTQGHSTDLPIYEALLRRFSSPRYIGGIGSSVKALKTRSELLAREISEKSIAGIRTPIGLPLGGNRPAEIAISIVAELLQVRDQKNS